MSSKLLHDHPGGRSLATDSFDRTRKREKFSPEGRW